MQSSLAARLEFEMLDRVGNVDALAVDACLYQRAVQEKPCRPNKRTAFAVFSISRLLADQHDLGVWRTLAEYGLGRILPKRAGLTGCSLATQTFNPIVGSLAYAHGLTKYSTRIQAIMAKATLPMST